MLQHWHRRQELLSVQNVIQPRDVEPRKKLDVLAAEVRQVLRRLDCIDRGDEPAQLAALETEARHKPLPCVRFQIPADTT